MRLVDLFNESGHVYVSGQGYVHLYYYTRNKLHADYVANAISGRMLPHKTIYAAVVTRRRELGRAAERLLLDSDLSDSHRARLSIALKYARCKDRAERQTLAKSLKELTISEGT